jgi:hypothetical protein
MQNLLTPCLLTDCIIRNSFLYGFYCHHLTYHQNYCSVIIIITLLPLLQMPVLLIILFYFSEVNLSVDGRMESGMDKISPNSG